MNWLHQTTQALVAFITPAECPVCGIGQFGSATLCDDCKARVILFKGHSCHKCGVSLPLSAAKLCPECSGKPSKCSFRIPAAPYVSPVSDLIHSLKFSGVTALAPYLASLVIDAVSNDERIDKDWLVVPVPMTDIDKRKRGFNQAELIGELFAKEICLQYSPLALKKVRQTPDQASLSRVERLKNLDGTIFADKSLVNGRKILIIDDVITTGTTVETCAIALKNAGAIIVAAASVAFSTPKKFDTMS